MDKRKYIQCRIPLEAYNNLKNKKTKMEHLIKQITGKNKSIPMTKIITVVSGSNIRLTDGYVLKLSKKEKKK